ncbi:MAG: hypothetical protein AAFR61_23740 [Bacteroidota bacterium]
MSLLIQQNTLIDVNLFPHQEVVFAGACLSMSEETLLLVNFDDQKKGFDGFTIFRSEQVHNYREWTETDRREILLHNLSDFSELLPLSYFQDWEGALWAAGETGPIAFFTGGQTSNYFVGQLIHIEDGIAQFQLIKPSGQASVSIQIPLAEIDFFSFYTHYERRLQTAMQQGTV